MTVRHYEAWDFDKGSCIYQGHSIETLRQKVEDYVSCQTHINKELVMDDAIKGFDREALRRIGIQLYAS